MNAENNPTGLAAMAAMVIVWGAGLAGLDIPAEIAAAIVGLVAGVVSYFTPRDRRNA